MTYKVGYIVGSLSSNSINRRLAQALAKLAPPELELVELPIRGVPLYRPDLEADLPPAVRELKDGIESCDAILFVTPEYNRWIPGVLKNAIDFASRPWGSNSFAGKPAAITGTSPGILGAGLAQHQLRSLLGFLDMITLGQPEAYIQFREGLLADDDSVVDESTRIFLAGFMQAFAAHIGRVVA